MKVCKQCGQSVQDVETYCPRCGSGQLVADGAQRPQQRPQQPQQQSTNGGNNNQPRQPQQAPPGYRNPNAIPQQRPQPVQQGQQSQQGQRPPQQQQQRPQQGQQMQGQRPPQQQQQMQGQRPQQAQPQQFNQQQTGEQDEYGFGVEQPVQKKKLFGKDKAPKQPKQPKQPKAPKQPSMQNVQQANNGYTQTEFNSNDNSGEVITMKEWLITMLKMIIPVYGIIFMVSAWQGRGVKPSVQNYVKASVIMIGVMFIIGLILTLLMGTVFSGIISSMSY